MQNFQYGQSDVCFAVTHLAMFPAEYVFKSDGKITF